jgi:hypothetical protein
MEYHNIKEKYRNIVKKFEKEESCNSECLRKKHKFKEICPFDCGKDERGIRICERDQHWNEGKKFFSNYLQKLDELNGKEIDNELINHYKKLEIYFSNDEVVRVGNKCIFNNTDYGKKYSNELEVFAVRGSMGTRPHTIFHAFWDNPYIEWDKNKMLNVDKYIEI